MKVDSRTNTQWRDLFTCKIQPSPITTRRVTCVAANSQASISVNSTYRCARFPRRVMWELPMPSQVLAFELWVGNDFEFLCCLASWEPHIRDLQHAYLKCRLDIAVMRWVRWNWFSQCVLDSVRSLNASCTSEQEHWCSLEPNRIFSLVKKKKTTKITTGALNMSFRANNTDSVLFVDCASALCEKNIHLIIWHNTWWKLTTNRPCLGKTKKLHTFPYLLACHLLTVLFIAPNTLAKPLWYFVAPCSIWG